ncbi:Myb/SANT-like DNA-binding domain [Phytophthora infestans]|uniref:Myb/SANT-like DNA-binding domain n=1 Tax=Phytophthora infestans TaxID=4787 RepID=A0A833WH74_PHYIN|nr:Myb/SANT-like DNA-binding domain [Phytophthora infestans]
MSTRDDAAAAQRATWTRGEELALLERYFEARKDPSKATDKGVKSKAWEEIKTTLNTKLKKTLNKGQYKSKVQRLMQDYDLFKEITSLSGCGTCPQTGKPLLDDDVWDKLIDAKPTKLRGRIKEMRKNDFEHETICSLIAGKRCIIFSEIKLNSSVQVIQERQVRMRKALRACLASWKTPRKKEESALPQPNETLLPDSGEQSSVTTPAAAQDLHPSHERRVQTVKRIRDGASKTRRNKNRRQSPSGDFNEELGALLKTFTVDIKYKMRQEMGDQAPQSDSAAFAASPSSDD